METPEKDDEATLPKLTPKNAGGSQRVIKQIVVIDPNKLRLAGLDVKMAEALKKAKKKSQPKSKESKLAAAKSILNKKLKEALSKKSKETTSPQTPSKSVVKSIEDAAKKLSSSSAKNKAAKTTPKISVATLKSLMPPPSFPVSSLISPDQTVEIKVLKSDKTKQSVEVKIVNTSSETPQKIDIFPKASLKTARTPQTVKKLAVTPEIKVDARKKLSLSEDPPDEPDASVEASEETSQTIIVHIEDTQTPIVRSLNEKDTSALVQGKNMTSNEKDTSALVHGITMTSNDESLKIQSPITVHWESPQNEDTSLNEETDLLANQEEFLIAEAEMAYITPTNAESLLNASESSLKILTTSTPIRREFLPTVIESKVLSPCEKIDLSILTKKSPVVLTVPKKRYKLDQNWITSESNRDESVYINVSPVPKPTPPKPVAQESAIDFINNLSLFFAESQKNKSKDKSAEILTEECGEDATSFLVSLFEKKQDASPKTQTTPVEENKVGDSKTTPVVEHCATNDCQVEQTMNEQDSVPKKYLKFQVIHLNEENSPTHENKTHKYVQPVKILHDITLDASQSSPKLHSQETSFEDNKLVVSNSEKDNQSPEPIVPPSDLGETVLNATVHPVEGEKELPDVSISMISQKSSVNETLQASVPKSSTPPVSSRRKAGKPIPVLIPKLKKSRKLPASAQKPPEETISEKSIDKPEEESPTQPVQNKETFKDSIPRESTPCQTEGDKEELPDKITTQTSTQKTQRMQNETPKSNKEPPASTITSLVSKDSAEIFDELPTTSKTERPQRQRKISLKLIESFENLPTIKSPFQGVVDRTIEQMIKKNKESTPPTERPQRQRKVSLKLLESSESLSTTTKPPIQALDKSNEQDIKRKIELGVETERPQRQRKLTFKLLESSESISIGQVINRSVEKGNKEKIQLATATGKSQCMGKSSENKNVDSLIAIELKDDALKDPLAQLAAFHETVEKFELACESVKSKRTQNITSNLEGGGSSLSEYPFYDAICSEIPSEQHVQSIQPTQGKENVASKQISTKNLRKRKDSLKSRTFAGEQISIVSSDSMDIHDHTHKNVKNVPSIKQTRKRKDTPTTRQSEIEEVSEMIKSTPNLTETESGRNEEEYLLKSKEIIDNSAVLDDTPCFSTSPQLTNNNTPGNTIVKKRRGRPPKVKQQFLQPSEVPPVAEVSQSTTTNSAAEPTTTTTKCNNANFGGSWETLTSTDEHLSQEATQVEVLEKTTEAAPLTTANSSIQSKKIVICTNSNFGGSWETLPSADEHLSQEVTTLDKKKTGKSKPNSSKSKCREGTPDKKDDLEEIPEKIFVSAEDDKKLVNKLPEDKVIIEKNEMPKLTRKRGRPPKNSKRSPTKNKRQTELNETVTSIESEVAKVDEIDYGSNVENILGRTKEPMETDEVQIQEEKPSTSKSKRNFDIGPGLVEQIEVVTTTRYIPIEHEMSKFIKIAETASSEAIETPETKSADVEKAPEKIFIEANKVESYIDEEQSLPRNKYIDSLKLQKTSIDIKTSGIEPRIVEFQSCEKQSIPEDSLFGELKSKPNESVLVIDSELDKREVTLETPQAVSFDTLNASDIITADSLEAIQVEYEVSEGKPISKVDLCDQPNLSETSRATETQRGNLFDNLKLPDNSMNIETSKTSNSEANTDESHINEKHSLSKDDFLKELNPPSEINEPKQYTDLPKTKKPLNIVPHFEDLMFDLDHIESPSFSPIYESSRMSNSSDGFEELDDDFTSAIIETVAEAENSAEKPISIEEQICLPVMEKPQMDSMPAKESKLSGPVDPKPDIVKQSLLKSSENPNPTEDPKSDTVKESSAVQSSVFITEHQMFEQVIPNPSLASIDHSKKTSKDPKPSDEHISSLSASMLAKRCIADEEQINVSTSDEVSSAALVEKSTKENSSIISAAIDKKSSDNSSEIDIVVPNSALHSLPITGESPTDSKSTEELTSALYCAALKKSEQNKKEPRKKKAKNPFKMQPKENENESGIKSQSDFLGFNEEEIEQGQHSTSLRLSQSEDAETSTTEPLPTSSNKPKDKMKESQCVSGKKQKQDAQKWEKNSAKSLKNWLSKPAKSGSTDDVCDIKEDTKKQISSVPPKKRGSKVQNLTKPIPLEKDVEHLEEETNDADTTVKSVTEAIEGVIDKRNISLDKREKPKRGRKPKLKNVAEDNLREEITSSREDINSSSKCLLVDAVSINEKPKRGQKPKVTNDNEFKTPKSDKKPKVADQSIDVIVKKEPSENLITPKKGRARKRKRSVSEEDTPTPTEPPTKVAHLCGDLLSSDLFQSARKKGRPLKSTAEGPLKLAKMPDIQDSTKQKKYKDDYEFNPRLLLIRKKEELKSNEPLIDPTLQTKPIGNDDVQCALCMGYSPRKKWIQHVSSHYGIGWIVGQPPPLNINSRGSILSFMIEFYKISKVKGLNCRLCNSLRRSALGLIMHLEQCCLTEEEINETRIVCEYCKKNYTKASFLVHKRTCPEYLKQVLEEARAEAKTNETPENSKPNDLLSNTGRFKRKAVLMAETKLKKLEETTEFSPDDLIKHIPNKNIQSIESIKENWLMEINSLGKGFCASKTCHFTAVAIDDLIDHYQDKVCPYYEKPGYFCVKCKFHNENIEPVRAHVIKTHSPRSQRSRNDSDAEVDSSESSDSISSDGEVESGSGVGEVDGDGEKKPKRKKKPKLKKRLRPFHYKNPPTKEYRKLIPERCPNITAVVASFYDKFIEANYSLDPLFTFAKSNQVRIEASESYFPKSADSMKFIHNGFNGFVKVLGKSKIEPDQWKQLERLHGMTDNSEYTIYMGGPVKNIAWVPLDPHPPSNTQYLAVTVRKGLDKFTRFCNQKRSRSLIFIFKFDISLPSEIKAEIMYAIAIDEGPIHAIEFLPSGGYSPQMNRLGMLAVGTIETEIKIYSLPLKVEKLDSDFFPIVRLESSIELHLELLDDPSDKTDIYSSQCTCLVWSQTAGHNILVASFLNGFLGIWDISDDAGNLNRFDVNESKRFTPVSYFWTSEDRLMNLALHYDMNGPRWLVASNSTRKMMLYDLRDITQPMLLRVEVTINIINCIEWPVAWENVMFGLGDAMPSNGCIVSAFSPMSIMFSTRRFEKFCTGVTDIHYNIWRNCIAAGTDNGDIQVTPLREATSDVSQRLKIDEKTISTLDIVSLNGEEISQNGIQNPSDGMRVFDKDYKDKYGIVFGSLRKIKGCNKPDYYKPQRVPPLNLHRLMRVSKIKFNQNKNACDVLAIGYDNGLLRVSMHDWLKKD